MELLVFVYIAALLLLSIYGLHRSWMMWSLVRRPYQAPAVTETAEWPHVCVQLPIYNEARVVARLLAAVGEFDYPKDRLEVQVLDDSTDETSRIVDTAVAELQRSGFTVQVLRRPVRTDFKAGALRAGMHQSNAQFFAIFDADFVPSPDFLRKLVPHFNDPSVGMVQARWTHLNRSTSLLTRAQAVLIDAHFVIEHTARFLAGCFFNFNGTAGVWRREAIEDAGGWQGDTITEDLDLSYRSQLVGWQFVYLRDVLCAGELPGSISAFKSQQYRWTRGSAQVCKKLLWKILAGSLSWRTKLEAFFHLSANFCYVLMLLVALLIAPVSTWRLVNNYGIGTWLELYIFLCTFASMVAFYVYSQIQQGHGFRALEILAGIVLGVGIVANCAVASLAGIMAGPGVFVRTPKSGATDTNMADMRSWIAKSGVWQELRRHSKELAIAIYLLIGILYMLGQSNLRGLPFVVLMFAGYSSVLMLACRSERA